MGKIWKYKNLHYICVVELIFNQKSGTLIIAKIIMTHLQSALAAQSTTIFFVRNNRVESDSLYDFIMSYAEETTSPRGVENKLFVDELAEDCYQVRQWAAGGKSFLCDEFTTEDEAIDYIYTRTYDHDYSGSAYEVPYYLTEAEAQQELMERQADAWGVDIKVAAHILRKQDVVDSLRADRARKSAEELEASINETASQLAKLIEPDHNESYKKTCARLQAEMAKRNIGAIGVAFHRAVKEIRKR